MAPEESGAYLNSSLAITNANVTQCFQSVSDGKDLVAAAVTDKGVSTAANTAFQQIADNIRNISTGTKFTTKMSLGGSNGNWYTEANFNISQYSKYATLSINDIFVEFYLKLRDEALTMEKYYNTSTGILTYKWNAGSHYWNIAGDQYNLGKDCMVTVLK